jgi:hypothetical protein
MVCARGVSDVLTLTILPNAIANAGVDQTVCASERALRSTERSPATPHKVSGPPTVLVQLRTECDAANAVYHCAKRCGDQGTITFTWSVNSCDNAMDQMVVTITYRSRNANAGSSDLLCGG